MKKNIKLTRKGAAVYYRTESGESIEVNLICACPVSAPREQISIIRSGRREELDWVDSLEDLDEESRKVAEKALSVRYRVSRITAVEHASVNHGHRYLEVQTDRGPTSFTLREPGKNVTHLSKDHLVIRDNKGNRYEVSSKADLDPESQAKLELVL